MQTPLMSSGMARVNEGSHSFTCHIHVYPQMEWAVLLLRQLPIKHRTGKVCKPKTDVLPLCHATNRKVEPVTPGSGLLKWIWRGSDVEAYFSRVAGHWAGIWRSYRMTTLWIAESKFSAGPMQVPVITHQHNEVVNTHGESTGPPVLNSTLV